MSAAAASAVLEEACCALCGSSERAALFAREAFAPYGIVRCRRCGFAYLSPRPPERALRALYERGDYYERQDGEGGYASYRAQELALRLTFRAVLRRLERRGIGGGALLEVGCGPGYLLDEARGHFAVREGTEMAPTAAAAASARADRVYLGGLEAVPAERRYDVVLSSHVIEHVHRPDAFLAAQCSRLRDGGALVVATPWMRSPWQRLMGARWPSFKVPEHLLYFDRPALARLLREAGLVELDPLPWPHAFPLALVSERLGLPAPRVLARLPVWLPWTTVAMVGRWRGAPPQ